MRVRFDPSYVYTLYCLALPKCSLVVLIAAKKVAERSSIFNYEACYTKYRAFIKNHQQAGLNLSKQVFLRLFVDLVQQGFLRAEGEATEDVTNVNKKIGLGFRERELSLMIEEAKDKLQMPHIYIQWALHNSN